MNKQLIIFSILLFCTIGLNAGIKERFEERLPLINKLKKSLTIGENNKGYLTIKDQKITAKDKAIVEAENIDRKKVYTMLASKTNVSLEIVQKRRVAQIAKKAIKGIWLQKEDGTWYKK